MNNRLLVRGVWLADIVAAGLLLIIAACDGKGQSVDTSPSATSQATSPPTMQTPTQFADATATAQELRWRALGYPGVYTTPNNPTQQVWENHVEQTYVARVTQAALSPVPTIPPGAPPPNPEATPILGVSTVCDTPSKLYGFTTCWRGKVNGEWVSVGVGGIVDAEHPRLPRRGVVVVYKGSNLVFYDAHPNVQAMPEGVGIVRIVSADGPRLNIEETDPTDVKYVKAGGKTFVFDIATHQFVTP